MRRSSLLGYLATAIVLLAISRFATALPPLLRAIFGGLVLLGGPGALALAALRPPMRFTVEAIPALCFAASLAIFALPALVSGVAPLSLGAVVLWTFLVCAVAAFAATIATTDATVTNDRERTETEGTLPRLLIAVTGLAALVLAWGAFSFTGGGSVDRWWYLAFVRGFLSTDSLTASDPLLGSAAVLPRFACNAWLTALAVWAKSTEVDPVLIYERAAPLLLAPLALSAVAGATHAVLGSRRAGLVAVVIAALYWTSGGPFPAFTRLPEDKFLAILVLAPVLWTGLVRSAESARLEFRTVALVAALAAALAATHPLIFGISLLTIGPVLLLARARVALALGFTLAIVALPPLMTGVAARAQFQGAASVSASEHPVGRIHLGRSRLHEVAGGLQVDSRLLAHPFTIVALAGLPLLALRGGRELRLLVLPSLSALTVCFVPPLAALAAKTVTPWMVYRFLWAIPVVQIVAYLALDLSRRSRLGLALPLVVVALATLPKSLAAIERHLGTERAQFATPATSEFRALVAALRTLPKGSMLAAAPEISERIPGLSGNRVLAASDRATLVFAGDVAGARSRLRSRAAVLTGLWKQTAGVPIPSHVLFSPGAAASRYCRVMLFSSPSYSLCDFAAMPPPPGLLLPTLEGPTPEGLRMRLPASPGETRQQGLSFECAPVPDPESAVMVFARPGPWSAAAPGARCVLIVDSDTPWSRDVINPRVLEIEAVTGRAIDELTVGVRAEHRGRQRWNLRTRDTVRDGHLLRYALPQGGVDRVEITLVPSYLPFVKLRSLSLVIEAVEATP